MKREKQTSLQEWLDIVSSMESVPRLSIGRSLCLDLLNERIMNQRQERQLEKKDNDDSFHSCIRTLLEIGVHYGIIERYMMYVLGKNSDGINYLKLLQELVCIFILGNRSINF